MQRYSGDVLDCTEATRQGVTIQFGGGPQPEDWYGTLAAVCEGRLDPMPSIGRVIGLDEVPDALDEIRRSEGPPRIVVTGDGVTCIRRPSCSNATPPLARSKIDNFSSAMAPRRAKSTPNISYSSVRYPSPHTHVTRPLLRMSSTTSSSAKRTGSWRGSSATVTRMGRLDVRAAIALARTNGAGR